MPDSGSGTGVPVPGGGVPPAVPWAVADLPECQAVSLPRYVKLVGYDECAFYGVRTDTTPTRCREIWVQAERDLVARYLLEAQEELEPILHYPLCRKWITDERHHYTLPVRARWGKIIAAGVRAASTIQLGAGVNHATDPAIVGPLATTVTDASEIHVYYPATLSDEAIEIVPSKVVLSGGAVTLSIPRCRMVAPSVMDNPRTGLDYDDLGNFLATVDVLRVYNDPSTQGTLHYPSSCGCGSFSCPTCSERTQAACLYVAHGELGVLRALPGSYASGAWTVAASCCTGRPEYVTLNYLAGTAVTRQAEDTIIRLAHSKMPEEPCACEVVRYVWERDRKTPEVMTRERINCPFGLSDGAWTAYKFAQAMRLVRGGLL